MSQMNEDLETVLTPDSDEKEECGCTDACENTEECGEEVVEEIEKDEVTLLKERIDELEDEMKEKENKFLKSYADVENTRKRLINEFDMKDKYKLQGFVTDLLPALDNLERALQETDQELPVYQGIEMVYKQIKDCLKKEGVEEIDALDQAFDPNIHHAIMSEAVDGKDSDIVIEVLQKGYMLKDRVIRASMVKVSE